MFRVCASFRDRLEARPLWCSPPLDHSSSIPLYYHLQWPHKRHFRPSTSLSTSVLNSHSVSLCTLLLHSDCHIQGYTYRKGTSQQVLSLRYFTARGSNSGIYCGVANSPRRHIASSNFGEPAGQHSSLRVTSRTSFRVRRLRHRPHRIVHCTPYTLSSTRYPPHPRVAGRNGRHQHPRSFFRGRSSTRSLSADVHPRERSPGSSRDTRSTGSSHRQFGKFFNSFATTSARTSKTLATTSATIADPRQRYPTQSGNLFLAGLFRSSRTGENSARQTYANETSIHVIYTCNTAAGASWGSLHLLPTTLYPPLSKRSESSAAQVLKSGAAMPSASSAPRIRG